MSKKSHSGRVFKEHCGFKENNPATQIGSWNLEIIICLYFYPMFTAVKSLIDPHVCLENKPSFAPGTKTFN